jgi:hypothetical protein
MALLDLQGMEYSDEDEPRGGDSDLSVACTIKGNSTLSVALCDID